MAKHKSKPSPTKELEKLIKRVGNDYYVLRLYVTGNTARSTAAIVNIRTLCQEHLVGRYDLQVIDLYQQPDQAKEAQIIAAPTLVKQRPIPPKRLIGDLADRNRVLVGLNLLSAGKNGRHDAGGPTKWIEL